MKLPDCEDLTDESIILTRNEWQDLIKRLAEDGEKGIDRFIKDMEGRKGSGMAKRIEQIRKRLSRQSEGLLKRKESDLAKETQREHERWERYLHKVENIKDRVAREKDALERDLDLQLKQLILDDEIVKLVSGTPIGKEEVQVGLGARIAMAFRSLFYMIGHAMSRFWLWLKLKLGIISPHEIKREQGRRISFALTFPELSSELADFDRRFSNALMTDPKVRYLVKKRLKGTEGVKGTPFSGERYVKDTKSRLSRDLVEKRKRFKRRVAKRRETLIDRLEEFSKQEEQARLKREREPERIKKRYDEYLRRIHEKLKKRSIAKVKRRLISQLEASNYIRKEHGRMVITENLVKRFATLVFTKEIKNLAYSHHFVAGGSDTVQGLYQRARPISVDESSRMDLVSSLVQSRLRHPRTRGLEDDDILVHREVKGSKAHVVLIYDRSGSMDENQRIDAAKRAVLALYEAVMRENPENMVDIIALDTDVREIDLLGVWHSEPQGFTNTGEALRIANNLLKDSSATFRVVYLITDGLPEAYSQDGKAYAGNAEESLRYALEQARSLARDTNCRFTIIMLEPKDNLYIDAAKRIAKVARGSMISTDPKKLASEMLMDYVKVR